MSWCYEGQLAMFGVLTGADVGMDVLFYWVWGTSVSTHRGERFTYHILWSIQ